MFNWETTLELRSHPRSIFGSKRVEKRERSVSKMGFVKRGEFEALKQEVAALKKGTPSTSTKKTAKKAATTKDATKKNPVKKTAKKSAKKVVAKKATKKVSK